MSGVLDDMCLLAPDRHGETEYSSGLNLLAQKMQRFLVDLACIRLDEDECLASLMNILSALPDAALQPS